ncbi:hypothetical protein QQZ08_002689 [Neonectria magnoliae]|uniref:MARVEL domain-containing protein n=1 Tax=Neonectria magnoliae TaxID=2732573 RepID=A0ABR1IAQ6_9HYPO
MTAMPERAACWMRSPWRTCTATPRGTPSSEYGGRLDTVHDTEEIKWELWKVVYGVWNYFKNSGRFPEAENLTLEWCWDDSGQEREPVVYKTLSSNASTPTQSHSEAGRSNLHPADGVFSEVDGCTQLHSKGVYQIPFSSMVCSEVPNLTYGGRTISATHVAFASTRVMATCGANSNAREHPRRDQERDIPFCVKKWRVVDLSREGVETELFLEDGNYLSRREAVVDPDVAPPLMDANNTTTTTTTTTGRTNDDSDDDVVGFADAPWPPEPTRRGVVSPAVVDVPPPIVHAADPVPDPIQDDPVPPPAPAVVHPVVLTGWRGSVDSLWAILAFTLPWMAGTVMSWSPITRISLRNAPKEVMVSLVASTIETGSLLLFLSTACCVPRFHGGKRPSILDRLFNLWIFFLLADPFATGAYTWSAASFSCPDGRQTSARCQVGSGFITAVGVFRVFAQFAILAANLLFSEWLQKKLREKQQRLNSQV